MKTNGAEVAKLIKLREFAESEKKRVTAYTTPVLAEYGFVNSDTGAVITTDESLFMCEGDEARINEYYQRTYELHAANGWTGNHESCPALVADYAAINQENVLLPLLAQLMGVTLEQLQFKYLTAKKAVELVVDFYKSRN